MQDEDEVPPVDAVALTLAVWLGLIVAVTGWFRLADNAADQAALARAGRAEPDAYQVSMPAMAFGG